MEGELLMKESIGLMDPCGVDFTRGISNIEGRSDGRSFLNNRHHIARHPPQHHQIMTLAGVAQSVERVALITAKRSTSRSWVRAPPSAIPISKLIRAAVLLLFGRLIVSASSSLFHWHVWDCGIPKYERQVIACSSLLFLPDKRTIPWTLSTSFNQQTVSHGDQ
jgi:hypothetical protein